MIADSEGRIPAALPAWATWFSKLALIVNGSVQSGTTANRPTQGLYPFRPYGDTTLGIPIWRNGANTDWIDSTGASV